MTHLPKNPYCDAYQRAKMENVKPYRQDSARDKGFEKCGEHVTIDTMVLHGLGNKGNHGETDAVVQAGWMLCQLKAESNRSKDLRTLDVCLAVYTYHEQSTHADVEVYNPTEHSSSGR